MRLGKRDIRGSENQRKKCKQSGVGLQMAMLGIIRNARGQVKQLKKCPRGPIHHLRTDMKKISALLKLITNSDGDSTAGFVSHIHMLKNTLAANRENTVLLDNLKKYKFDAPILGRILFEKMQLNAGNPVKILQQIDIVGRELELLRVDVIRTSLLRKRFQRSMRRALGRMQKCLKKPDGKSFHQWRKRMKDVYYQNEVLRMYDQDGKMHRRNGRLCKLLGDLNDLEMLKMRLNNMTFQGRGKLLVRISKKKQKFRSRALIIGRKIF
ncbi:MAG: CHAD domain-containing protein [Chthoniobacterales bacterium]